jgi:hypothetical protein
MVDNTKRFRVNKIYIGRAAVFGLLIGIPLGILVAFGFYFFGMTLIDAANDVMGSQSQNTSIFAGFCVALGIIFPFISSGVFVIFALIYNLISKIGGRMDFGLEQVFSQNQVYPESDMIVGN